MTEQQPFAEPSAQNFLWEWCKVNDSIIPQFISRKAWAKQMKEGILSKSPNGKQNLILPDDVRLWELVGVMETVDADTFAANPNKAKEKSEQLRAFGATMKNAGIYIAQRMDAITPNSQFAENLATELYKYGSSLTGNSAGTPDVSLQEVQDHILTEEETTATDEWLAGPRLYRSRMKRLQGKEGDEQAREELRRMTLQQFFRAADRSMKLQARKLQDNDSVYAPVHSAFLDNIEASLRKTVEKPKQEFITAVFRRGIEKLAHEMKDPDDITDVAAKLLGLKEFKEPYETLWNTLRIDSLKSELSELRKSAPPELVAKREMEIALKIRNKLLTLRYESGANNPSEMVVNTEVNCLGSCLLAGAFLKELSIDYLQALLPGHAVLLPVTTTGRVFYFDLVNRDEQPVEVKDGNIHGKTNTEADLTVADLVASARDPRSSELSFNFVSANSQIIKSEISALHPSSGQEMGLLLNLSNVLEDMGLGQEAILIMEEQIKRMPNAEKWYTKLLETYIRSGEEEKAWDIIKKALRHVPRNPFIYGQAYYFLRQARRNDEAYSMLQKGIKKATNHTDLLYGPLISKLFVEGNLGEALTLANENIRRNPHSPDAYLDRGRIYERMGSMEAALDDLKHATDLESRRDPWSYIEQGRVLQKLKRYDQALDAFHQAKLLAEKRGGTNLDRMINMINADIEQTQILLSQSE